MLDHIVGQHVFDTPCKVPRLQQPTEQQSSVANASSPYKKLSADFLTPVPATTTNTTISFSSYKESPLARRCKSVGKMLRRRGIRLSQILSGGGGNGSSDKTTTTATTPQRRRSENIRAEHKREELKKCSTTPQQPREESTRHYEQLLFSCGNSTGVTTAVISAHPSALTPAALQSHHQQQHDNSFHRPLLRPRGVVYGDGSTEEERRLQQQLLLLRRSRRRTLVRTNGSLPVGSGRQPSCYYGGEEEEERSDGNVQSGGVTAVLTPCSHQVPGPLRALPVIPFWEDSGMRLVLVEKEEEENKDEEEAATIQATESLDCLIAQAQAELRVERSGAIIAQSPKIQRRNTAATPTPAQMKRRTMEVNQNYLNSPAANEKSVYMTMEVMTSSASKPLRRHTAPHGTPSTHFAASNLPLSPYCRPPRVVERSDYIDMASFPMKE